MRLVVMEAQRAMSVPELGRFLYQWRTSKGLSQAQVGIEIGRTQNFVSRLEKAHEGHPLPDAETLKLMAKMFGMTLPELLEIAGYADDSQPESGTDEPDESARIYTMIERNQHLTAFQRQLIRMAWEESERRRKEIEG